MKVKATIEKSTSKENGILPSPAFEAPLSPFAREITTPYKHEPKMKPQEALVPPGTTVGEEDLNEEVNRVIRHILLTENDIKYSTQAVEYTEHYLSKRTLAYLFTLLIRKTMADRMSKLGSFLSVMGLEEE